MRRNAFILLMIIMFGVNTSFSEESVKDPAAEKILETILWYQQDNGLTPYSVEDNVTTGSDYTWGLWMMALVAAQRNGYLSHEETVERLGRMLKTIQGLEKYKGWLYWGYHLETLEPNEARIGFQGWYLYSLIVIKSAYPELKEICEKLLNDIDYEPVYDKEDKFLSDYVVDKDERTWRIPLGPLSDGSDKGHAASERRVAYVVYSYLTEDLSPWLLETEPHFQELEGLKFLSVWKHYNFDIGHLHYVLPEVGYFDKTWENFLKASKSFMEKEGLKFFPTRSGTLEDGLWNPMYPNTEHRESMPWITWYLDPQCPVFDLCYKSEYGLFRYYDQWNFYWSYGKGLEASASIGSREGRQDVADSTLSVEFFVNTTHRYSKPPKLVKLSFDVSIPENPPLGVLEVYLNNQLITTVNPDELTSEPTRITRDLDIKLASVNKIIFKNSDKTILDHNRYILYSGPKQVGPSEYSYRLPELALEEGVAGYQFSKYGPVSTERKHRGPRVEVVIEGQNIGPAVEDTCTAFLIRIGVMHDYYVWKELLRDDQFWNTMVAWVGSFTHEAKWARVVHNVSDSEIKVEYEPLQTWEIQENIAVIEKTTNENIHFQIDGNLITWDAKPYGTYLIKYQEGSK